MHAEVQTEVDLPSFCQSKEPDLKEFPLWFCLFFLFGLNFVACRRNVISN